MRFVKRCVYLISLTRCRFSFRILSECLIVIEQTTAVVSSILFVFEKREHDFLDFRIVVSPNCEGFLRRENKRQTVALAAPITY